MFRTLSLCAVMGVRTVAMQPAGAAECQVGADKLKDPSGIIGALGVSGDTSCADHYVAWRVRHALGLDKVPNGPSKNHNDAIIYDIGPNGKSASGFDHPSCDGKEEQIAEQIGAGVGATPSR